MVIFTPRRGDIVWLEFDPQKGKEIQKTRPTLVLSPIQYNQITGLALCMPITTQIKGYPFEVKINGKKVKGAILCDQIRSLDWRARNAKFIEHIDPLIIDDALAKFQVLIN